MAHSRGALFTGKMHFPASIKNLQIAKKSAGLYISLWNRKSTDEVRVIVLGDFDGKLDESDDDVGEFKLFQKLHHLHEQQHQQQ